MADALASGERDVIGVARQELVATVGPITAGAAIGVIANFQMMNRILDATGVPTPPDRVGLADAIGVDPHRFGGAHGAG